MRKVEHSTGGAKTTLESGSNSEMSTIPRIVIAGSGPIGLYSAILLKKRYPMIDVMVIDARMKDYQRPGIIAKQAVLMINAGLEMNGIPLIDVPDSGGIPENNVFIRDLQRSLMRRAASMGVTLVEESFASITEKVITTKDGHSISCDMLIDCTGESRAVAKFLNNQRESPVFKIESISDNPIKTHFIAYVDMDKENFEKYLKNNSNPIAYVQAMQELRALGWAEFAEPEFTPTVWIKKESEGGGARCCFYFEIPDTLVEIQAQEDYLAALLFLKSGEPVNFTRVDDALSFIPFAVEPKSVTETMEIQPAPITLCGDALLSPEYRLGTGVSNGVRCANQLVASTMVSFKGIVFDQSQYISRREHIVKPHIHTVEGEYQGKKSKLAGSYLRDAYTAYTKAFKTLEAQQKESPSLEGKKDLLNIEQGLADLAEKFKLAGDAKFLSAIKKRKAQQIYKDDAAEAEKNYECAVGIYVNYCANLQQIPENKIGGELTRVFSNLAKTCLVLEKLDKAIDCAERAIVYAEQFNILNMLANDKLPNTLKECYTAALKHCDKNDWAKKIPLLDKLIQLAIKADEDPQDLNIEKDRLVQMKESQEKLKMEMSALQAQGSETTENFTGNLDKM